MSRNWNSFALCFAILGGFLLGSPGAQAADTSDLLQFKASIISSDPFHDSNQVGADMQTISARPGNVVTVLITGKVQEGYHTYPLVKKASTDQALSRMDVNVPEGITPLLGFRESEPELVNEEGLGPMYEHKGTFTWEKDFLIQPWASPTVLSTNVFLAGLSAQPLSTAGMALRANQLISPLKSIKITLNVQACDENRCVFIRPKPELTVGVEVNNQVPLTVSAETWSRIPPDPTSEDPVQSPGTRGNGGTDLQPGRSPGMRPGTGGTPPAGKSKGGIVGLITKSHEEYKATMEDISKLISFTKEETDLWTFVLTGAFFGFISLLTPCVFPMIPITVSYFLKESEKDNHRPLMTAAIYSGTIVIVLTIAAVAFLGVFRALSINPLMNLAIGGLLIFFALSLLGWYDIELPSWLTQATASRERQGGVLGTMFMALTFTIISFACVAPFLGAFGGIITSGSRPIWHLILGGLAFAITFAAPFCILALFPALLKQLPKSGSWLNSVKVVMGFLELAAAFKFIRMAEVVSFATPTYFTYDLVMGIWIALCLLCGLYLLGVYRLPHDTPLEHIGVPRLLWAVAFLALGFYLVPALFKTAEGHSQRPGGDLYAWVDSFLLPRNVGGSSEEETVTGNLEYAISRIDKKKLAPGQPERIFIDFTGETCTNCRLNEQNIFTKPEIQRLLSKYLIVKLYTDKVPPEFYASSVDVARLRADAEVNLQFQKDTFKDETLPLYVILERNRNGTLKVLGKPYAGKINQQSDFADFLENPEQHQ